MLPLIGAGLIAGASSLVTTMANLFNQAGQNDITRAREDNAVQRRVADLEAAGLNPVLAAGDPASAQPLRAATVEDPAQAAMAGMKDSAAASLTDASVRKATAEADIAEYTAQGQKYVNDYFRQGGLEDLVPQGIEPGTEMKRNMAPQLLSAIADLREKWSKGETALLQPELMKVLLSLKGSEAGTAAEGAFSAKMQNSLQHWIVSKLSGPGGEITASTVGAALPSILKFLPYILKFIK